MTMMINRKREKRDYSEEKENEGKGAKIGKGRRRLRENGEAFMLCS